MKYSMKYLPMSNEIINHTAPMENEIFTIEQWNISCWAMKYSVKFTGILNETGPTLNENAFHSFMVAKQIFLWQLPQLHHVIGSYQSTQSLSLVLSQRGGVGSPTGNHFRYSHHVKGTLSNRLFGATFDVMDETERQQTTEGVTYVSRNPHCSPWRHQKSLLLTSGNTKLVCIRVPTWACSRPCSR